MSAILILSILVLLSATGLALFLSVRRREWRLILVALGLALMALRQVISLSLLYDRTGILFTISAEEVIGLLVSVLAFAGVYFFLQILNEQSANLATAKLAKTQLTAILNHTADSIITIDEIGEILTFNHAAELLFGYDRAEIIGRNVRVLMPEPHRTKHDGYLESYRNTGKGRILGIGPRELIACRKDGSEMHIELAVSAMTVGDTRSFVGVVRDITRRKSNEARLEQVQRLEVIGKLTGGIAHDFNNLLQVVIGNLELLEGHLEAGSTASKLQEIALRAGFRGADLTQRLLAYSRRQALDPKVADINQLVPDITEFIRTTLGKDINVETVLAGGLWPVAIDKSQLETAILNLAINARDAMPSGGKLTIETANVRLDSEYSDVRLEVAPGRYVMLAVSDTGEGMTPAVAKNAFDPFFTTKDVGKGSGLGLSMVYGFVKQSGGHAAIYSELGKGTTVKLYLPISQKPDKAAPLPQNREGMPAGKETILVVEDEAEVRSLIVGLLGALGYDILQAADGPAALALMERSVAIDLLFTDVVLPNGMAGREIANEFAKRFPNGAILFMSGYTENSIVHHGRLDEGVELLGKPFTRVALAKKVRHVLDRGRPQE